ncbi:MAG: phage terminase large subunit [Candidatus Thiodiazotropha lotti]|nr:phage terminase large subunit [Candidatus Thiodiazotropha lotti]
MSEISTSSAFTLTKAQDRAMDVLISDATHTALGGGSRSGKTFLFVRAVIIRALREAGSRHSMVRFRFNAIKSSIIYDTLPKVIKLCFPDLPPAHKMLNKSDWFLKLPNDSEIWFGGLDDKERVEKILGNEYATVYFNECSQIPWQSVVLALTRLAQKTQSLRLKAYYDFNPPSKKHWTYMRFIEKRNPETKQPEQNPHNFGFYLINPEDNTENLDPEYLNMLRSLPEKARKRFLLGQFADESEGQLWTEELLATNRRMGDQVPEMLRIVIAVDPSGCSGPEDERSDEVGIAVCGLGIDGHGYLLEDLSGRFGPEQWSTIVNSAFERHKADRVVGEKNFGGAMVEAVLKAKNPDLPYKEVNASRGKVLRAEPISTLYEQGKIHHVGYYPEMEDQMCAMTVSGYQGLKSPDRADAGVHGFTELFPMLTQKAEDTIWTPPTVHRRERSASRFEKRRRY